ncbi:cytochrome c oxidase assembly protein COX18, mitochondrial [Colossoma macropomum]|uniref:cytochrome c oxidase assembly protein COX18, mitochondrial n=1 Tax=Colossoma macropomum TaxID=42526 RepID=UPI001863D6E4|nr:cytochrome c oxidase assembly protein COX18, mitochondrial [Colossoma macropomum]
MRFPTVMWLRAAGPVTTWPLRFCCHGNQVTVKPQVRCISHSVFTMDFRGHFAQPLVSKPVLFAAPLATRRMELQLCRNFGSARPGWYESIADSGPVHLTEQLLVFSQQTTGLPWWASIICTTLALRTAITLPLAVYQTVIIAKVEALQKEIAELARRLSYEISVKAREKGWSEKTCRYHFKKNLRRIVSELYVRDNCHPFKASLLVWVQLPMWVFLSLSLRNLSMGTGHVPAGLQEELAVGGALWFSNLTLPDSTWIIPVSLGLVNLLITEIFALRQLEASKFQKYVTNFIRGISLVMIPLAAAVPSSMALYWLSSSCVGLGHNLLLRSPRFRALCRMPPTHSDSDTPYRDIAAAFVAKYIKLKT